MVEWESEKIDKIEEIEEIEEIDVCVDGGVKICKFGNETARRLMKQAI